jgi:hypothetical protein
MIYDLSILLGACTIVLPTVLSDRTAINTAIMTCDNLG